MNSSNTHKHMDIWPSIRDAMEKKYDVILWLDLLLGDTDLHLGKLYNVLAQFQNFIFTSDQRIIIYHRDSDYYPSITSSGFTLYNLYKLFNYLDIPTEHTILITAHTDLTNESAELAKQFNSMPFQLIHCQYQWWPMPDSLHAMDINTGKIKYPFVCLNGAPRSHRIYTLARLQDFQMFAHGMTSLWRTHTKNADCISAVFDTQKIPTDLSLCGCVTPTRIHDYVLLDSAQQVVMLQWGQTLQSHVHPAIAGEPNQADSRYQADFLQYALWNIITETVGEYPYSFLTEKTVKAILTKRPFVILGGGDSLQALKNLGFKTFDSKINESYSQQLTFANRCDAALVELEKFCCMTQIDLQHFCTDIEDILEFNFDHYIHTFGKSALANFIENTI